MIEPEALDDLVAALTGRGYRVVGPTVRDGAIVYDELESAAELPDRLDGRAGRRHATGSSAATTRRASATRSARTRGSSSCCPPRVRLWRARRAATTASRSRRSRSRTRRSRSSACAPASCTAIAIQDRVLLGGRYADRDYAARREDAFVVAVNCFEPAGTCFCVSMGTGPEGRGGLRPRADRDPRRRRTACSSRSGSERGAEVLARAAAPRRPTPPTSTPPAPRSTGAAERMGRQLDTTDIRDLLARNLEHPRWDDVADALPHLRQLHAWSARPASARASRTSTDLDRRSGRADARPGTRASRSTTRTSTAAASGRRRRSRYRQWLTHKFGTWHDQFGSSGCVGCGRCITWCPVGIDVTEELDRDPRQPREAAMETIETLLARRARSSTGLTPEAARADRRLRLERALPRGRAPVPRRRRGRHLLRRSGTAASRSRRSCRRAAPSRSRRSRPARSSAGRGSSRRTAGTSTRARSSLVRATSFDGACLRGKCESDPQLGYDLMSRFAQVMIERLQWTRLRLLDVYGYAGTD